MKKIIILIISAFLLQTVSLLSQRGAPRSGVMPKKAVLIEDFLREHFSVLPGDQLYRAEDLWTSLGSKKMKFNNPSNSRGKDLIKSIVVEDVEDLVDGYYKFSYNSKNETINSMTISASLEKGDFFLDKFIEMQGKYEPARNTGKNVEFSGSYFFDDFTIKVTEYSNPQKLDIVISDNPNYNRLRR
ncbi:MAG: hypothetical protein KIT33_14555 [Candidatus Kapabacteria bacterium]|nr:hypothetical protein [Ignavibacteriota bacterium]MCW5886188.1 hypothetical protein [Candidatus Kapabacteria bacterium]